MTPTGPTTRHDERGHFGPDPVASGQGPGRWWRQLWESERTGVAIARDVTLVVLFIGMLMGALWGYSGQGLDQPPLVVVESGSMMHPEAPFGRIGTIDPGDLVLVKKADGLENLPTAYDTKKQASYGGYGEVIVFRPLGDADRTPIIHRALTWVEVVPAANASGDPEYEYHDHAGELVTGAASVELPEVGIVDLKPTTSGFVTKGDNPDTNHVADQVLIMPGRLVEPDWIVGAATGQAPWIGLIKLGLTGNPVPMDANGQCKILRAWAPCDSWAMLGISAGALFAVPLGLELIYKRNETLRRWAS